MPLIQKHDAPRPLKILDEKGFRQWQETAPDRLKNWADAHGFVAKKHTSLILPSEDGHILGALLGAGKSDYANGAIASRLPDGVYCIEDDTSQREFEQIALGFALDQYQYSRFKTDKAEPKTALLIKDADVFKRISAIASGVNLTRDLINTPANYLTPQGMEDQARQLAQRHGADIDVTIGDDLAQKYPAIHVVGRAAEIPPRLIDIKWSNANTSGPLITLIGKGVTFDSGGLDLKPSGGMEMMKKDMGGAAHVLGLAEIIMSLNLDIKLRVLVPTAENAVSSLSMRPLDVIDTAAGIPVEVGNTDAEGRLILADALHLATTESPDLMIDFATLTGAARVAVGTELPALFANDDTLRDNFIAAGHDAADPLWPLPLHEDYDRYLDGGYAALSSTGTSRYGGAITAALFLQRFLQKPVPWAHIDVMAWNLGARPGHPRGGEAMGLRAALALIENQI